MPAIELLIILEVLGTWGCVLVFRGTLLQETSIAVCFDLELNDTPLNDVCSCTNEGERSLTWLMQQTPPSDAPRFPPAISVQRLAPQVQRQIRETQELIKDSCSQLYTSGYGSPGPPPMAPLRTSASATASAVAAARAAAAAAAAASVNRRATAGPSTTATTLETQYSQELS
ncbi:hypothetical protein RP20_CCG014991 [Aedes albopictus]|nr:hypothetical protein RP20_CCG014991 [Aedes albopictus]